MSIQYSAYGYGEGSVGTVVVTISDPNGEVESVGFKWRVGAGSYGSEAPPDSGTALNPTKEVPLDATQETFVVPVIHFKAAFGGGTEEGAEITLPVASAGGMVGSVLSDVGRAVEDSSLTLWGGEVGESGAHIILTGPNNPVTKNRIDFHAAPVASPSGADGTILFHTNGIERLQITRDGDFWMGEGKKLFFDHGGDTYINESAANLLDLVAGGTTTLRVRNNSVDIGGFLTVPATARVYLDGGGDTYIYEPAANLLDFVAGGSTTLRVRNNSVDIGGFLTVPATARVYLDGGIDTYIHEAGADNVQIVTGGAYRMAFADGAVAIPPTSRLYLDGGGDTYVTESSADVVHFFVGATSLVRFHTAGVDVYAGIGCTARIASLWGNGANQDGREHFTFGRTGAGSSSNPYYTLKTDWQTVPAGILQGWDGTNVRTFLTFDHGNARVLLGEAGSAVALMATPNAEPSDESLDPATVTFWLDESGHALNLKVKYGNGTTVRYGQISLGTELP